MCISGVFLQTHLSFTNSVIETISTEKKQPLYKHNWKKRVVSLIILPIMMSSMQPITASKAVSAAEELEEEKNSVRVQ